MNEKDEVVVVFHAAIAGAFGENGFEFFGKDGFGRIDEEGDAVFEEGLAPLLSEGNFIGEWGNSIADTNVYLDFVTHFAKGCI